MSGPQLTIGALARATGLPVKTVRYYSEIGLLPESERSQGGYRLYTEADLRRLRLIQQARLLQIPLAEVARLVHLAFDESCRAFEQALQDTVNRRLAEVDHAISELVQLRGTLSALRAEIAAGGGGDCTAAECTSCSLIDNSALVVED
ncbi:MAG: MerR family transcriptional regulator [Dehalococcoidia bacterium]